MKVIQEIMSKIEIMKGTYDSIRIIDPLNKNILYFNDGGNFTTERGCYYLWNRNSICENCISLRAYLERDTFIKFEYLDEYIILITAIPIVIEDVVYVVELMKDISKSADFYDLNFKDEMNINDMVEELNNKFIIDDMTGVYNRRYIDEKLIAELQKNDANEFPMTVLMIEIDSFQKVMVDEGIDNSTRVIKDFVSILKAAINTDTDWIGRFEDNKFIVVLSNINTDAANKIGSHIMDRFRTLELCFSSQSLNATALYSVLNTEVSKDNLGNIYSELIRSIKEKKIQATDNGTGRDSADVDQLTRLNKRIEELRETLNEICACSSEEESEYKNRLRISEYLDDLIVEYMRNINKLN